MLPTMKSTRVPSTEALCKSNFSSCPKTKVISLRPPGAAQHSPVSNTSVPEHEGSIQVSVVMTSSAFLGPFSLQLHALVSVSVVSVYLLLFIFHVSQR